MGGGLLCGGLLVEPYFFVVGMGPPMKPPPELPEEPEEPVEGLVEVAGWPKPRPEAPEAPEVPKGLDEPGWLPWSGPPGWLVPCELTPAACWALLTSLDWS